MPSEVNPFAFPDGAPLNKIELRRQYGIIRDELDHGGYDGGRVDRKVAEVLAEVELGSDALEADVLELETEAAALEALAATA